jgi:hypothetical protein
LFDVAKAKRFYFNEMDKMRNAQKTGQGIPQLGIPFLQILEIIT